MTLILASASPRRKELLTQLGYEFTQIVADIDETPLANEKPTDYVLRLAKQKALAGLQKYADKAISLGADTIVVYNGELLGKPQDKRDAIAALTKLQGNIHQVITAVAVTNGTLHYSQAVVTEVEFCNMSEQQILKYWQTGEPADKAGSYGIQGIGGNFVKAINGSYSAVVGLPLVETDLLLKKIIG